MSVANILLQICNILALQLESAPSYVAPNGRNWEKLQFNLLKFIESTLEKAQKGEIGIIC